MILTEVVDPDYKEEIELLLNNGYKDKYVLSAEDILGYILVLLCPRIKLNGKLQQPNQ